MELAILSETLWNWVPSRTPFGRGLPTECRVDQSLSGYALDSAGVHETILMMNNEFIAESANINELVEVMNILTKRKDKLFTRAMSNSFGFGGTNCALVFDKYDE
jgi:3-oxoacyl-[acyl-carrier-protein] synthase-1